MLRTVRFSRILASRQFDVNDPSTYVTPPISPTKNKDPLDYINDPHCSDAPEFIKTQEITVVNGDNVRCDGKVIGSKETSGHPEVFISLAEPEPQYCRYCFRPYIWERFADQFVDDVKSAPRAEHNMPVGSYWNH